MADQILVLHAGRVVESGTHEELLALKKGRYATMWRKQIRAERAAEEARVLQDRAAKLKANQSGAGDNSGEVSDTEEEVTARRKAEEEQARADAAAGAGERGSPPEGHP